MLKKLLIILIYCLTASALGEQNKILTLSLKEAIFLAIRENPNVQTAQLNHVQQKFALEVAQWQFRPHYSLTGVAGYNKSIVGDDTIISKGLGVQPQATWLSPIGTQVTLTNSNNINKGFSPGISLEIMQPLMRGFGRPIVEAALCNAIDTERVSRLNVENTLRTTVTAVINAYLGVVSAANIVKIDEEALARAERSVHQTKLFIQAGRKAKVELVTVQGEVANAKTKLENDKNALDQARFALLTAIGIDPNTTMQFSNIDVPVLINKFLKPSLEETKRLTLQNDIQYQIDQITIEGATKRSVMIAEDNARWQLNLSGSVAAGGGQTPNNLVNVSNISQGLQLNLTVPIDDKTAQQAIVSAKIALREAQNALRQQKWAKETNAINNWNSIYSAERAQRFALEAEQLQQKTYEISFQKYTYGLIDSLELQNAHQQLIVRQQALLDARINYLKALVNLDQQIGMTLKTWEVPVRYS